MRQISFSGLTLVGYYGYNNLGDDLMLLSTLTLLEEIGFKEPIFLSAVPLTKPLLERVPSSLDIRLVKRFDPLELTRAIGRSKLTVFGGGNLLQDQTSSRSFLYYYAIASHTLKKRKSLLFLSQGFGPVKHKSNERALDKILSNRETYGIMRDGVSYKRFASMSNNAILGTDYGPYYLLKKGILPAQRKVSAGLAVIILKGRTCVEDVLRALKLNGLNRVCAVGFHNHHDEEKRRELESKARATGFDVCGAPGTLEGVVEVFNSAQLIVTERLHGVILATSMGIPFVWKKNAKLDRFVQSIDKRCDLFFEDDCESLSLAINSSIKQPPEFKKFYRSQLEKTVADSKRILKILTDGE